MFNRFKSNSASGFSGLVIQNGRLLSFLILAVALAGFEMFNFSTTQYALEDLLGNLKFMGIQWSTILAIAFCGIDFAGIGRLFLPDAANDSGYETWYLFGAWLLAATMNALLTWWGVSMALESHTLQSTEILDRKLLIQAVPIFVAMMVWVTRVLLIGSFAMAARHSQGQAARYPNQRSNPQYRPSQSRMPQRQHASTVSNPRPAASLPTRRPTPLPMSTPISTPQSRTTLPTPLEPEYIPDGEASTPISTPIPALRPLGMSAQPSPASRGQERKF